MPAEQPAPIGSGGGLGPRLSSAAARALESAGLVVQQDPSVLAGHAVDWTGHWRGPVLALVRPASTSQVTAVLSVAAEHSIPVQVQGGNTGLVGGSVPEVPSLLLSTTALDRLHPVDPRERTVLVGAGVTAARLAAHARASGLRFGVDLAARDSATVGGMAATNAGGIAVLAHGMMREQVRGLTAVLGDGRVVRTTGRPRKDNTGYDLTGLLVGSEGTLGVITEVEVRLHPAPPASTVALLAVDDLAAAVALASAVQSRVPLLAAEVVDDVGVARACADLGVPDPLGGAAWLLLLEAADGGGGEGLAPVGEHVVAVASDESGRRRLWAVRERQTELYAGLAAAGPEKLDVSVRLDRLDELVGSIRAEVAADREQAGSEAAVGFFGHVLDGNLHVQLQGTSPPTAQRVLHLVARLGGSISAEHGVGRQKSAHLPLARPAEQIAWMRQLRASADPAGLLNRGVLLG